jgi:hypothetical protein
MDKNPRSMCLASKCTLLDRVIEQRQWLRIGFRNSFPKRYSNGCGQTRDAQQIAFVLQSIRSRGCCATVARLGIGAVVPFVDHSLAAQDRQHLLIDQTQLTDRGIIRQSPVTSNSMVIPRSLNTRLTSGVRLKLGTLAGEKAISKVACPPSDLIFRKMAL